MIIDSRKIETGSVIKCDICVVGAGVAGIPLVRELVNSQAKVILLESGDFQPNPALQSLNSGKNIGLPYYNLDEARVRAFGGTSHRWHVDLKKDRVGVRLRGLDSIDFEKRDWVPYSGWPFQKVHLDPYYERAHEICKIGPYTYETDDWVKQEDDSLLQFNNGHVKTTIFQFARKEIFYEDYRRELENAGNITTYLNATVQHIQLTDNAKHVTEVQAKTLNNKNLTVRAKHFILALGGLEIPRLLLLSNDVMEKGVGNQNDLVGRFFMEHPHLWSGVYYPSDPEMFKRLSLYQTHDRNGAPVMGKLTISEDILRKEKLLNFTASIHPESEIAVLKSIQSFKIIGVALKSKKLPKHLGKHLNRFFTNLDGLVYAGLKNVTPGNGNLWQQKLSKFHGFSLNVMAEQIPDPESRIMLDRECDKFGQNKIKLNWKLNSQDINSIRRSQEIIDRELQRSGLGRLDVELLDDTIPPGLHGGWHHMGTTRMHTDPNKGVVDENCKIHGIDNLFIAGASVFPTGGYANPTLTTVALSVRLADHMKKIMDRYY